MAWDERDRGRRYYYRSVREGGRVRRVYLGAGPAGELGAGLDACRMAARRDTEAAARELSRRVGVLSDLTAALLDGGMLLASAAFLLAGYRRRDRHPWERRKRRGKG